MEKYIEIIKNSYSGYWNYLKYELIDLNHWDNYFYGLIGISLLVWILEILFPWRKDQSLFRKDFWLDTFYMFFNFFLLNLIVLIFLSNTAEAIFKEVLPYYESRNNKAGIARMNYSLATLASLRSQHQKSIPYYEISLALNSEMNRLEFVKDINQKLFIAYNIVQDTAKANEANRVYNIMKDSLDSQERKALIADMKTKYETEKIEQSP